MQNRKQFCTLQAEVGKCLLGQSRFTQDVLADAIEAVKGEIAQIHREQSDVTAELENQTITKENIKCYYDEFESWADEFDKATNERKRMILSKLYDHIEVRRYYDISVYLNQNHEQFLVSDVGCGAKCFLHHILTVRGVRKCRYLPKRVWFGHLKLVEQRYLPFSCK